MIIDLLYVMSYSIGLFKVSSMTYPRQHHAYDLTGLWLGLHALVRLPDLPPSGPLERGCIER